MMGSVPFKYSNVQIMNQKKLYIYTRYRKQTKFEQRKKKNVKKNKMAMFNAGSLLLAPMLHSWSILTRTYCLCQ